MGEIRSAWEIAQEKANKLGELSAEERKRQREERCHLMGKALAEKYLSKSDLNLFETELGKHSGQDKKVIGRAVLDQLVGEIDFRYGLKLDEIGRGILKLVKSEEAVQTVDEIKELFREYQEAEDKERQEIEKAGGEILHRLRISGTAINRINIRAKEEWQKKLSELARPFEVKLKSLKQKLLTSSSV